MLRSRVVAALPIAILTAPLALLEVSCSRGSEQQLVNQFFRAARNRDNETLARMSAVPFDPRTRGVVEDFDIVSVGEEQRTPLDLKALLDAEAKARETEAEFTKRKMEYQTANRDAINEILKLERDPGAKMSPAQMKVKADWDKWRQDTTVHSKGTSAARSAVTGQTGPVEASLNQPGQPAFSPSQFKGQLLSKDVTVSAQIRSPEGQVATKTLVLTLQRALGTLDGREREGRWIITRINET